MGAQQSILPTHHAPSGARVQLAANTGNLHGVRTEATSGYASSTLTHRRTKGAGDLESAVHNEDDDGSGSASISEMEDRSGSSRSSDYESYDVDAYSNIYTQTEIAHQASREQQEKKTVVCLRLADNEFAEVAPLSAAELRDLELVAKREGILRQNHDASESLEEGVHGSSEDDSSEEVVLNHLPYLSVGFEHSDKQLVKLTHVLYVHCEHPAAILSQQIEAEFRKAVQTALRPADCSNQISAAAAREIRKNSSIDFASVSSSIYFASLLAERRVREANEAIQAALKECEDDSAEFRAPDIREKLRNIQTSLRCIEEVNNSII